MNKKIVIIASILGVVIILLALGAYFYIKEQNRKLTLSYLVSQCKEVGTYEEYEEGYADAYKGTKYVCYNKDYNQLVKFKEDEKSSQETYAFRVETPVEMGNSGDKFEYEIARIVVDTVNPKASKCTYNYRGKADWKPCEEKALIKSLPEISIAKEKAYSNLEPLLKEMNERAKKYYMGENSEYNEAKAEEVYEKYEKQLDVLRNTKL